MIEYSWYHPYIVSAIAVSTTLVGTALVEGTTIVGVNEVVVARGIATAVIDGTKIGAREVVRIYVVMVDEAAPTDVEIVGVKEAMTITGFVGKRGITGVAIVNIPVDARSKVRMDPQLRWIYSSLLKNVKVLQKERYLLQIQQTFNS